MTSEAKLNLPLWRWATEDGEPQVGSEHDLVQQLESGRLPPYALVWKDGWGEWLPALEVAELAMAFSDASVGVPRRARPSTIPGVPPVPVSEYPRVRMLAKAARPAVGVAVAFDCPEREVITSEVPIDALLEAARVMNEPRPPLDLGLDVAIERASAYPRALAASGPEAARSSPPSRPALPLAAEFGLEDLLEAASPAPGPAPWLRSHGLWIALAALLLGVVVVFAVRGFAAVASGGAAAGNTASAAPLAKGAPGNLSAGSSLSALYPQAAPAAGAVEPALACHPVQGPRKLDDWAVVDVRPSLLSLGEHRVALGYAQSHKQAMGVTLDSRTLAQSRQFGQHDERQIFSVTPLGASRPVAFHVERMGELVAFGRGLDTLPPRRVGMNDAGLVAGPFELRSEKLWELPPRTMISVPEIAAHARGFTLVTRTGRATGTLRLGLLGTGGQVLSPLEALGKVDSEFGKPALASGPAQTLLAVSLRSAPDRGHALLLSRAPNGELPRELEPLDVFGEADVELTALAVAGLPDGGFAVMWSQGEGVGRRVRVQRLSSTLVPLGSPLELAMPEVAAAGATAGALHAIGDRLLAFFFVRREAGNSLWVTSLSC